MHGAQREMAKTVLGIVLVLGVIFVVPIVIYGLFSSAIGLQMPGESPVMFLAGVLVSKAGTAIAFVWIFHISRDSLSGRWFLYAVIWWVMFAIGEVGQAIGPDYSWEEALAGIISETIYFPISAYVVTWLFNEKRIAVS